MSPCPSGPARRGTRVALAVAAVVGFSVASGGAQEIERPLRLPAFGKNLVSVEDTTALVVNPANLAFLPGAELRWSSVYLDEAAWVPWQGHAVAFGFPLPLIPLATGLRIDTIDPPDAARHAGYQWLTWGMSLAASETAALGFSLQRAYSTDAGYDNLSSWSFGFTSRAHDAFGVGFVAHHINSPRARSSLDGLAPAYDLALSLRPLSSRVLELGLESRYVDQGPGYWVPRATLGLDIPPIGRLRGDFSLIDPEQTVREREWLATAGLEVDFNGPVGSTAIAAGTMVGDALGPTSERRPQANLTMDIALRSWREPVGLDAPRMAVQVRIESTPETREHVALLRTLWRYSDDPGVDAVVLELRDSPAASLARAQELRDAVSLLRQSGRRVLCHLEDATGSALYVCAAADRTLINPAGGVRFAGLRSQSFYFSALLAKLGIRAEFVRIGEHKSAPEAFVRQSPTDVAERDRRELLNEVEKQLMAGIAAGRGLSPAELRKRLATGPFVATEAKRAKLVDGYAYHDQLEKAVAELVGHDVLLVEDAPATVASRYYGAVPGITVIYIEGDMVDGRSSTVPGLGMRLAGSYTIAEAIRNAAKDDLTGAIVLRIETPGGSSMAADVIWRAVQLAAAVKPVVVSMGSVAASGGYYVASAGTKVFANPLSITGSIGVFYGKVDVSGLLDKIGVSVSTYKTAPRADAESIYRPFTEDERRELKKKVGQWYDIFLSRVALGRNMTVPQVDAVGRGKVWTGEQALEHGLVDELGGLRAALQHARVMAGLPAHAPIRELPPPEGSLLGRVLGIPGVQSTTLPLPEGILEVMSALGPFVVHDTGKPLARIEYAILP